MIETVTQDQYSRSLFCNTCAHDWRECAPSESGGARRFASVDDLVRRAKLRREEVQTLAEIGALHAFGHHRREALWQAERAVRPAGELFDHAEPAEPAAVRPAGELFETPASTENAEPAETAERYSSLTCRGGPSGPPLNAHAEHDPIENSACSAGSALIQDAPTSSEPCPLPPMSDHERLLADYAGTGMTIGPHPMAMRRGELATRGVLRAIDLPRGRHGRRVRVAGTVITRQRPGTAKGFVFLTLEDETGIANVIIRPDLFAAERTAIIKEPFLLIEGILQLQDGVTSVKAERVEALERASLEIDSHDFH